MQIRDALPDEFDAIGQLLVDVYSSLDGFPTPAEQPGYYRTLREIGAFTAKPGVRLLVAVDGSVLLGSVLYFGDIAQYGADTSFAVSNASGIRLLGVAAAARGMGVGRALTEHCISLARSARHGAVILHSTRAMQVAWQMYLRMGFIPAPELDFMQRDLTVYGFRLALTSDSSEGPTDA